MAVIMRIIIIIYLKLCVNHVSFCLSALRIGKNPIIFINGVIRCGIRILGHKAIFQGCIFVDDIGGNFA